MKKITLVVLNIFIILFELIGFFLSIKEFGYELFTYYTQYSNFLALISSILLLICLLKNKVPKWLRFIRYVTAHLLTITFLIVSFVLVPLLVCLIGVKGFMIFIYGSMLYHHLLCPILFIVSFLLFEEGCPITKKDSIYVLIPTCIYGITMIVFNAMGIVDGPYPFFRVLYQPLYLTFSWMVFIMILSYCMSIILFKISSAHKR